MRALFALALLLAGCDRAEPPVAKGTTNGPLPDGAAISAASGGERLSDLGRDGFRVLIAPSFGRYRYYVSMRRLPIGCIPRARSTLDEKPSQVACGPGQFRVRRIDATSGSVDGARFVLPVDESETLVRELDARLARWSGMSLALDGTGFDLERVSDGRIVSISGNASSGEVDDPTTWLSHELLRILLAYGPTGFAPRSSSWHVREADDAGDPCNNPGLATPLDRGFGTGNSDCDAAKRWP